MIKVIFFWPQLLKKIIKLPKYIEELAAKTANSFPVKEFIICKGPLGLSPKEEGLRRQAVQSKGVNMNPPLKGSNTHSKFSHFLYLNIISNLLILLVLLIANLSLATEEKCSVPLSNTGTGNSLETLQKSITSLLDNILNEKDNKQFKQEYNQDIASHLKDCNITDAQEQKQFKDQIDALLHTYFQKHNNKSPTDDELDAMFETIINKNPHCLSKIKEIKQNKIKKIFENKKNLIFKHEYEEEINYILQRCNVRPTEKEKIASFTEAMNDNILSFYDKKKSVPDDDTLEDFFAHVSKSVLNCLTDKEKEEKVKKSTQAQSTEIQSRAKAGPLSGTRPLPLLPEYSLVGAKIISHKEQLGAGSFKVVHRSFLKLEDKKEPVEMATYEIPQIQATDTEEVKQAKNNAIQEFDLEFKNFQKIKDIPGVVGPLAKVRDGAKEYYAMPIYPAGSLSEFSTRCEESACDVDTDNDEKENIKWVVKNIKNLCLSLLAAHEKGLIHKDLKPANLLRKNDAHGRPGDIKIGDWGLAHEDTTYTTAGTPAYMHPLFYNHPFYSLYALKKFTKNSTAIKELNHAYDYWGFGTTLLDLINGTSLTIQNGDGAAYYSAWQTYQQEMLQASNPSAKSLTNFINEALKKTKNILSNAGISMQQQRSIMNLLDCSFDIKFDKNCFPRSCNNLSNQR